MSRKQRKTTRIVKKIVQDLKMGIEVTKTSQTEEILEMENLSQQTGTTDESITKRIQETKEKISDVEDMVEEIDSLAKKKKC